MSACTPISSLGSASNRPPFIYVWSRTHLSVAASEASNLCSCDGGGGLSSASLLPIRPSSRPLVLNHHPNERTAILSCPSPLLSVVRGPSSCGPWRPAIVRVPGMRTGGRGAVARCRSHARARGREGAPRCIGRAPKVPLLSDRRADRRAADRSKGGTCGKEKLVPTVADWRRE